MTKGGPLNSTRTVVLHIYEEGIQAFRAGSASAAAWILFYRAGFELVPFGRFYVNTVIMTIGRVIGQMVLASLAAYAFARLRFPGRNGLFVVVLAVMMVPSIVTMIPRFILLASHLLVFEKPYETLADLDPPPPYVGDETTVPASPFLGDPDALLKNLLPSSPAWDMEMNLFTFNPGGSLPLVEVHVMEHGLLFLQGGDIYRLDERWYPVQAGDVIWMGPFCPQWFAAVGKTPARYLYYKDVNRHPQGAQR